MYIPSPPRTVAPNLSNLTAWMGTLILVHACMRDCSKNEKEKPIFIWLVLGPQRYRSRTVSSSCSTKRPLLSSTRLLSSLLILFFFLILRMLSTCISMPSKEIKQTIPMGTVANIHDQPTNSDSLRIAMFPFFAFGHISPFVHLSNNLSSSHPTITIFFLSAPANIPRISASLSPAVHLIPLDIPPVDGLPPEVQNTADATFHQSELLKKAVDDMKPQIESLLVRLNPHIVFHDFAHQWMPSIANPLNIKSFFFSVFSAVSGAYLMVPARLPSPSPATPTLEDLKKPPPGFPSTSITEMSTFEARDMLYVFKSFFGGTPVYEREVAAKTNCSAIVLKTCLEMEAPYLKFIEAQYGKRVLLAGPVVPQPPTGVLEQQWADWLGKFPEKSVVFCSFGSETFLKDEQIQELLLGLEMAGPPFLAVLNFPGGDSAAAVKRLKRVLPEGFEERVKEKGVVHTGWVQQQHILAHPSVGCFVCHAGLSSIAEALVSDCQLVLLPQKGDQFLNSRLVGGDLKAGVEVERDDESGNFKKEDVCEAVKAVMERGEEEAGKTIRENHSKWRDFLRDAKLQEKFLEDFVGEMKRMVYGEGSNNTKSK